MVLLAGGVILGLLLPGGAGRPEAPGVSVAAGRTVSADNPSTGVRATATLRAGPTGTDVSLTVAGVTPGLRCRLIAVGRDGREEVIGDWRADYRGAATITSTTAVRPAELTALRIVTDDGAALLTLAVRP